jgi:hypothetical protein
MLINRIGYYNLLPARTDLRMAEGSWLDLLFYICLQRPDMPVFVIMALPPEETGQGGQVCHGVFSQAAGPRRSGVGSSPVVWR